MAALNSPGKVAQGLLVDAARTLPGTEQHQNRAVTLTAGVLQALSDRLRADKHWTLDVRLVTGDDITHVQLDEATNTEFGVVKPPEPGIRLFDEIYDPAAYGLPGEKGNPAVIGRAAGQMAVDGVADAVASVAAYARKSPYEVAQTVAGVLAALPTGGEHQIGDFGLRSFRFEETFPEAEPTLSTSDLTAALGLVTDRSVAADPRAPVGWSN